MNMGRIKGTLVKRTTKDLLKYHKSKFNTDLENNKKAVSGTIPGIPKKIRNSVAGYATRLMKREGEKK